jgi:hypothetical protein
MNIRQIMETHLGFASLLLGKKIDEMLKRQSEAGAPIGNLDDGSQSITEKMEVIRVEEIINALISDARITVTLYPGQTIQGTGGNAGGPVVVVGQTLTLGKGTGIIQ